MEVDLKKLNSILIHNIISNIKGINAIGIKMILKFKLMKIFIMKILKRINKKIKSIIISFKINFIKKSIPKEYL